MYIKYFECHITIEPVFGTRLEEFTRLAAQHGFKVADLIMQKARHATPERSNKDTFCTSHSKSFDEIQVRMNALTRILNNASFKVWRSKIEAIVHDERFEREPNVVLGED